MTVIEAIEGLLQEKRNKFRQLKIEVAVLDAAINRAAGGQGRAEWSTVKAAVLDLLAEVGSAGLTAAIAVDLAERRGQHLQRNTVSSFLSRLKRDGTVTYDGAMYRLSDHRTGTMDRKGKR